MASPGNEAHGPPSGALPAPGALPPQRQGSRRPSDSQRFPKSMRLHSRVDFDELFQQGKVIVDQVLVIHGRPTKGSGRIGISIAKRVGHSPCRNRWKRLIREAYRRQFARLPALQRLDLIVRPRRGAVATYSAVEHSLRSLAVRLDKQLSRSERGEDRK